METPEIILGKVKQFFNDLVNPTPILAADPAPVEPPISEYELKDGGKVSIDKLEVGGIVMIDGGTALPGDIELADGTKITISDNGVIVAIELAVAPSDQAPVTPAVEDMTAKFTAFENLTSEKFANYEIKFSAYEQRFAEYEVKMAKANKVIEELLKLSTLIVEAPITTHDPAIRTSNNFSAADEAMDKKQKQFGVLFS
jgi:hypothetical protein